MCIIPIHPSNERVALFTTWQSELDDSANAPWHHDVPWCQILVWDSNPRNLLLNFRTLTIEPCKPHSHLLVLLLEAAKRNHCYTRHTQLEAWQTLMVLLYETFTTTIIHWGVCCRVHMKAIVLSTVHMHSKLKYNCNGAQLVKDLLFECDSVDQYFICKEKKRLNQLLAAAAGSQAVKDANLS